MSKHEGMEIGINTKMKKNIWKMWLIYQRWYLNSQKNSYKYV